MNQSNPIPCIGLFGPPGCGKGTQSALLVKVLGYTHISTGDLLRAETEKPELTELGKKIKPLTDVGAFVPDDLMTELLENAISKALSEGRTIVFDGYPRNEAQVPLFNALREKFNLQLPTVFTMDVPEDELVRRLLHRGTQTARADDQSEETIRKRLLTYDTTTHPVLEMLKEAGCRIVGLDGRRPIDVVFEEIKSSLTPQMAE